ncbi:MAG: hypothetical protein ACTSO2_17460 [Promethearchaeota archaeon]
MKEPRLEPKLLDVFITNLMASVSLRCTLKIEEDGLNLLEWEKNM